MSKTESTKNIEKNVRRSELDGWSKLAEDTERELALANDRVKKLKAASRIFADNARRGEFFPGKDHQPTNA
jgi:hypothetical protein